MRANSAVREPVDSVGAGGDVLLAHPKVRPYERNAVLDGLKYAAACAIVLHHAAARAGGVIGSFLTAAPVAALFFFFAAAGYFHGSLGGRGHQWRVRRFLRLATPYAVWSAIYLLWVQRGVLAGGPWVLPNPLEVVFLAGAHGVLWSLPVLLTCALFADVFVRSQAIRRVLLCVGVGLILATYWLGPLEAITMHRLQNFIYAPRWFVPYLIGMEIRAGSIRAPFNASVGQWATVATMLFVGAFRLVSGHFSLPMSMTIETTAWILGASLLLHSAVQGAEWFSVDRLAWGRDYLVGVYVSHVLWLDVFGMVAPIGSLNPALWIALSVLFALTCSTLTVRLMLSNRLTRYAVL